jgi:hypothetical protein
MNLLSRVEQILKSVPNDKCGITAARVDLFTSVGWKVLEKSDNSAVTFTSRIPYLKYTLAKNLHDLTLSLHLSDVDHVFVLARLDGVWYMIQSFVRMYLPRIYRVELDKILDLVGLIETAPCGKARCEAMYSLFGVSYYKHDNKAWMTTEECDHVEHIVPKQYNRMHYVVKEKTGCDKNDQRSRHHTLQRINTLLSDHSEYHSVSLI